MIADLRHRCLVRRIVAGQGWIDRAGGVWGLLLTGKAPAAVGVSDDGDRSVVFLTHDAPSALLTGDDASESVERASVGVIVVVLVGADRVGGFVRAQGSIVRDV